MHSDLHQSDSPRLSMGEVRQEDMSSHTGETPVPLEDMASHTGGTPVPPLGEEHLLELIAEGRHSVEAICIESGMSILELAAHVCTPRNLEALERVRQLHATQREMMLGRLKRDALMRLGELTAEVGAMNANEVRACEVMRKACVDILRFGHGPASLPHSTPTPRDDTPEPLNEEKILEALERLGEETNQDEPRAQVSGSVMRPSSDKTIRTGKMPMPLVEAPSKAPPESCSSFASRSRNGPGACGQTGSQRGPGACASGSLQSGCRAPPHSAKM